MLFLNKYKRVRNKVLPGLLLSALLFITACGGLGMTETMTGEPATGTVSLALPTISATLLTAIEKLETGTADRGLTSSRAFLFLSRIDIGLYDAGGSLIDSQTVTVIPDDPGETYVSLIIPTGTGYTLSIDAYNTENSLTEPVVSGESAAFDIIAGEVTLITIICVPTAPIILTETVDSGEIDLVPTIIGDSSLSIGEEAWFSFTPSTSLTELNLIQTENTSISQYLFIYDQIEGFLTTGGLDSMSNSLIFPTLPGQTYYIGCIDVEMNSKLITTPGRFKLRFGPGLSYPDGNTSRDEAVALVIDGEPAAAAIEDENDVDYFSFPTIDGYEYTLVFGGDFVGICLIYNDEGEIPKSDSTDSSIVVSGDGSTFYVEMRYSGALTDYTIQIRGPYADSNACPTEAVALTVDESAVTGTISNELDSDFFSIDTQEGMRYTVVVTDTDSTGIDWEAWDEEETELSINNYSLHHVVDGTGGTVYFKVFGSSGDTGDYSIEVLSPFDDDNSRPSEAVELIVDAAPAGGNMGGSYDLDYFTFPATANTDYTVSLTGVNTGNMLFEIYHPDNIYYVTGYNLLDKTITAGQSGDYTIVVIYYDVISDYSLEVTTP